MQIARCIFKPTTKYPHRRMRPQAITSGSAELIVCGGFESMSNAPHYLPAARGGGLRLGHGTLVDGLLKDGLWDPHGDCHMGDCAERCAAQHGISRQAQGRQRVLMGLICGYRYRDLNVYPEAAAARFSMGSVAVALQLRQCAFTLAATRPEKMQRSSKT